MSQKIQKTAQDILDLAGIKINGDNPWDIQVKNENFYKQVTDFLPSGNNNIRTAIPGNNSRIAP